MNLSQKIALNTIVQFIGRIFTAASSLVITMIISWKLGAEGYGQYIRIVSYVTIWFVLLDFGINPIAVKDISKETNPEKQKKSLRENFRMLLGLRGLVTLIILTVATMILFLLPEENYTLIVRKSILIAYIQIVGQSIVSSCMPIFQITLTYFWATLSNLIGSIFSLFLVVIAVLRGGGVVEITAASMGGWVIIASLTYFAAARHAGFVLPEYNLKKWKALLKRALPVGLALLFNVVFVKLNMQLLQVLELDEEVLEKYGSVDAQTGYYGIALRFFDILITIPFFFSNAIYPILVQRREESVERLSEVMNKALKIMIMIGVPISVGGFLLAPQIIFYVSGGFLPDANPLEFLPAIPALRILILGTGLFFTTGVITWTPIIMDNQWLLPKMYGVILLITVIANLILLPPFGYLGATAITLVGELGVFILHLYFAKKLINFRFEYKFFIKTLVVSVIMGIIMFPFRNMVVVAPLLIGMVSFAIFGTLGGVVDLNLIKTVTQR